METNSARIYRFTADSALTDLPRAPLTTGMMIAFVPLVTGMSTLTGGGSRTLDGISTEFLALPTVFDVMIGSLISRWLLRLRAGGEVESTATLDSDKTLIVPDDDPTLVWALLASGGTSASSPSAITDNSGNSITDNSGNAITSN